MAGAVIISVRRPLALPRPNITHRRVLDIFVLIQIVSTALFFLPGTQSVRMLIRSLPYLSAGVLALVYLRLPNRNGMPAGGRWVMLAMVLLTLNLIHPTTNHVAGLGQIIMQFCIASPVLWVDKLVADRKALDRVLLLFFFANGASALVGVLQTYYPGVFMPPELNQTVGGMDKHFHARLMYVGADGTKITRPPGLSDMPGGASFGGAASALLGIVLGVRPGLRWWKRLFYCGTATLGMVALYLTLVRSIVLMTISAVVIMSLLLARQGRIKESIRLAILFAGLTVGAFLWAVTIGGTSITDRFVNLAKASPLESYQENRGGFVALTFNDYLLEYPLGAGIGRWGIMTGYLGAANTESTLHAEIQMTGWLYDGGIIMWVLYGGAILQAMYFAYGQSVFSRDKALRYSAGMVFCLMLFIVGMTMAGPAFNTQFGTMFWLLAAALYGAANPVVVRRYSPRLPLIRRAS